MPRRLSAFAVALVVAVLPVTGVICEGMCAEHDRHEAAATAVAHHHHTPGNPVSPAHHEVTARTPSSNQHDVVPVVLRGCVQPEAVSTESRELLRKPTAGRATTTVDFVTIPASVPSWSVTRTDAASHVAISSISPLRI